MSVGVTIDISRDTARPAVAAVLRGLSDRKPLHESISLHAADNLSKIENQNLENKSYSLE